MISQLLKILRESIKAVPAMKYALAVAGILAVVAMVGAFKDFNADNDPHGEHDFGAFEEVAGAGRIFWKIDQRCFGRPVTSTSRMPASVSRATSGSASWRTSASRSPRFCATCLASALYSSDSRCLNARSSSSHRSFAIPKRWASGA